LANGATRRCTRADGFLRRTRTCTQAQGLTTEASGRAGYSDSAPSSENLNYRPRVRRSQTGQYVSVRDLAAECHARTRLAESFAGAFVRHHKNLPSFDNRPANIQRAENYNHKIVEIRYLNEKADVYDITVDVYHNFLLTSGVFVHNSIDGDNAAASRYTE